MDADSGRRSRRRQPALRAEVGGQVPTRGRAWLARSVFGAETSGQSDAGGAGGPDRGAAPSPLHRARDRRAARNGALDGLGDLDSARIGPARAARARAAASVRVLAPGRAPPPRRQEARPLLPDQRTKTAVDFL